MPGYAEKGKGRDGAALEERIGFAGGELDVGPGSDEEYGGYPAEHREDWGTEGKGKGDQDAQGQAEGPDEGPHKGGDGNEDGRRGAEDSFGEVACGGGRKEGAEDEPQGSDGHPTPVRTLPADGKGGHEGEAKGHDGRKGPCRNDPYAGTRVEAGEDKGEGGPEEAALRHDGNDLAERGQG